MTVSTTTFHRMTFVFSPVLLFLPEHQLPYIPGAPFRCHLGPHSEMEKGQSVLVGLPASGL